MKKKILLMLSMALVLVCMLALAVSADSVHSGKVDLTQTVTLDDGTVCNLFDAEGNALIWFKNGSELQSIRADDERVIYKCTYAFNVGNSTVGSVTAYEVSDMWIALDSGNINKVNIVVLNLMDDDVLINNNRDIGKPVNCLKTIAWGNKVLEYAFCRLDTVAIQQQAFCGCPKLKYVNLEDLTELRQIGGDQTFGQSSNLFKGESLDLTGTKLCAISGKGAFNGVPVAEISLPKTVTTLNDWNIQGTAITSFVFPEGVTSIAGSQFKLCASLTEIYINNTTTKISDNAFLSTNKFEKIFFVGTKAELEALITNTSATGNSTFLAVAENIISYAEYLALEDKSGKYAVYGYSYCEAYNDGKHDSVTQTNVCVGTCDKCGATAVKHSADADVTVGVKYAEGFADFGVKLEACTCDGCDFANATQVAPIFGVALFSVKEDGTAICVSYTINNEAYKAFLAENEGASLEFGIVAAASIDAGVESPLDAEMNISHDLTGSGYSAVDLRLTGDWETQSGVYLSMALYTRYKADAETEATVNYVTETGSATACQVVTYAEISARYENNSDAE